MGMPGGHERREERQGLGLHAHAEVPGAMSQPETTHLRATLTAAKQPQLWPLPLGPAVVPGPLSPRDMHHGSSLGPPGFAHPFPHLRASPVLPSRSLSACPPRTAPPNQESSPDPLSQIHGGLSSGLLPGFLEVRLLSRVTRWTRLTPWQMTAGGPLTSRPPPTRELETSVPTSLACGEQQETAVGTGTKWQSLPFCPPLPT